MWESSLYIDYVIFVLLMIGSISMTLYGKFSGPKERTKADFAFAASRPVSVLAMMLSIARGFLGVRVFLGYPSELYYRGSAMWETLYGMIIAFPLVCFFFIPVYYTLGITSVYQYLDLRFKSRLVRCLASGTYVFRSILNLGVTVFTPCVALKTIIGLPYWVSISSISAISILFTVMGGLRSAILADVSQLLVMVFCSLIIIIQGTLSAGGPANVLNISQTQERFQFFNFDLDPTVRVTTISAVVGQLFMSLSLFGCQQNFVQRYCSMQSQTKVIKTLLANIPLLTVIFSLSWIVGMVVYAHYYDCDPRALGYISDIDEILPFYIEDKFYFLPGFLGLVMASLFNGSLNLMFSNLNSLAIVLGEDFLFQIPLFKNFTEKTQLLSIKCLGAVCGLCVMAVAFWVSALSGVIEASMLMTSATSGPLLGVFILAMFCPPANWKGAAVGMIFSHATVLWITYESLITDKSPLQLLPVSVDGCTNSTFSPNIPPLPPKNDPLWQEEWYEVDPVVNPAQHENEFINFFYSMTYMYYALLGTLITVTLGILVSLITTSDEDCYDEKLVHPWAKKLYKSFPGKRRYFLNVQPSRTVSSVSEKVERYKSNGI